MRSPTATGFIPPLARQHGRLLSGAPADTSPFAIHEGEFTDGTDLPNAPAFNATLTPPASLTCPSSDVRCAWINDATGDLFAAAPVLGARLTEALGDASGALSKLDASTLTDVLSVLSYLPGVHTTVNPPQAQFLGYASEGARWLHEEVVDTRFRRFVTTYADPIALASQRERGARLYCAAREAQNRRQSASTKSMGKQSAFSFTLFGQQIDVLSVEPTIVLDGPGPFIGLPPRCPIASGCPAGAAPADGGQAFTAPFLFGVQITPISFLPSLAEVRYPVVMVSGDTEVLTGVDHANNLVFLSKAYQTATHTDALLTEGVSGSATATFPIAQIGPVEIDLGFDLNMGIGLPATGTAGGCGLSFANPPSGSRGLLPPTPNAAPSWPTTTRSGYVSNILDYDDGPWTFGGGAPSDYVASNGLFHPFNVHSSRGSSGRSRRRSDRSSSPSARPGSFAGPSVCATRFAMQSSPRAGPLRPRSRCPRFRSRRSPSRRAHSRGRASCSMCTCRSSSTCSSGPSRSWTPT